MFLVVNPKFWVTPVSVGSAGSNTREGKMQANIHPATRRIAWLVVVVGAAATCASVIYSRLNLGQGILLPFTGSPLDSGWLFVFGLLWLVTGVLALWWLRPSAEDGVASPDINRLAQTEARLVVLEKAIQAISPKLKTPNGSVNPPDQLHELNLELDSLGTSIQDIHRRLDELRDVNARLDELALQLDALYITVQDAHKRIDDLVPSN
jgi:hypothetical protein